MSIKWKLISGFALIVILAGVAAISGIFSLLRLKGDMEHVSDSVVNSITEQVWRNQQTSMIRLIVDDINNAASINALPDIDLFLEQRKVGQNEQVRGLLLDMSARKREWLASDRHLGGLRKETVKILVAVKQAALTLADDTEFNSVLIIQDAAGQVAEMSSASGVLVNDQMGKIAEAINSSLSMVKAGLSIRTGIYAINAAIHDVQLSNDVAFIDYSRTTIFQLFSSVQQNLSVLEGSENIEILTAGMDQLRNKTEQFLGLLKNKLQKKRSYSASELREVEKSIEQLLEKVQALALETVDTNEFDTTILIEDTIAETGERFTANTKKISENMQAMADGAMKAFELINSSLVARTICFEIANSIQEILLSGDVYMVDSLNSAINAMFISAQEAIGGIPDSDERNTLVQQLTQLNRVRKQTVTGIKAVIEAKAALASSQKDLQTYIGNLGEEVLLSSENLKKTVAGTLELTRKEVMQKQNILVIVGGFALCAGAFLAFVLTRGITRPLYHMIAGLSGGANQFFTSSQQITAGNQLIAQGASQQASSLEEISSSLQEMTSQVLTTADNTKEAARLSSDTENAVRSGEEAMKDMERMMIAIEQSSNDTAKIIKSIEEIAFQTNLLALNAAVEAARAGDAGKGFAVVADEVRALAIRCTDAAQTTSELIDKAQTSAQNGSKVSASMGKTLREIIQGVLNVSAIISEIASASQEQSSGINQVNRAIAEMNDVTQTTAANAEESASASDELASQAQELNEMVGLLIAMVGQSGLETYTPERIRATEVTMERRDME